MTTWNTYPQRQKTVEQRFWEKVLVGSSDDCWLWSSATDGRYGLFYTDRDRPCVQAHRIAYELANNMEVPSDMLVCHHCDMPLCVNPAHLYLGSHADNMRDMVNRGRQRDQRGMKNNQTKLTENDVVRIFELRNTGLTQKKIAEHFTVRRETVAKILRGERWTHLGLTTNQ